MKKNQSLALKFLFSFSILILVACKSELPIQEMADARGQIARAENLQAQEFAPEELSEAKKSLFKAHNDASEENGKDAKKMQNMLPLRQMMH
jgi:hypothetical protein